MTMRRPEKHNALSAPMVEALLAAVEEEYRREPDLLVIRGAGPSFSAGFDIGGLDAQSDGDLLRRFIRIEQLLQALHEAPFETAALVHGSAVGAGADIVCACTHRIGTPDSTFRMPGLAFGIVLGTRRLATRVGRDAAETIQVGGRAMNATDAHRLGFLTEVIAPADWDTRLAEIAERARRVPVSARAVFRDALSGHDRDADLAGLVRSAAVPGLVDRVGHYARGRLSSGQ
ncbi:MAG: hypothetical protein ABS81_01890 [Pseudonocardia sp. SCN 72-86]|nr:MAG: hypothetical protein ABS81_01890 [Pseudonocardia sp. SCN 72-86]